MSAGELAYNHSATPLSSLRSIPAFSFHQPLLFSVPLGTIITEK